MIATIYARKSTEQKVADAEKSVTRQLELARAFAAEHGWQVIEEYVDDGVSGRATAHLVNRARMLSHATAGKFSVLIVRDYDRLSRDDREGPAFVYALQDAGVDVWEYMSGAPIDTNSAMKRGMLGMKATFASAEAEAAQARTREQKFSRAQRQALADDRVLGYRNVGERLSKRREIDPAQAPIVVRIFELAASGKGFRKIAKALNADGIKNPTGRQGNTQWTGPGIRDVLHRRLYLGEVTYGRERNEWKRGTRKKVMGDKPVTRQYEELRIISDELWKATHARMKRSHEVYLRRNNGQLGGKPSSGLESRYLLASFLKCGVCGGNMIVSKSQGRRGRPSFHYVCSARRSRGGTCTFKYGVPERAITEAVLSELRDVLSLAVISDKLTEVMKAPAAHHEERETVASQVADLDRRITKLLDLYEREDVPDVAARLKELRRQRDDAKARLEHLEGLTIGELPDFTTEAGRAAWADTIRPVLADLHATLAADPAKARQVLRDIVPDKITVTPLDADERVLREETVPAAFKVDGLSSFEAVRVWQYGGVERESNGAPKTHSVSRPLTGQVLNKRRSASGVWLPGLGSNQRHPD